MDQDRSPQTQPPADPRFRILKSMESYFQNKLHKTLTSSLLNTFSVIDPQDPDRLKFSPILKQMSHNEDFNPLPLQLSLKESRGMACILGNAIGDALGASTEFMSFKKERYGLIKDSFKDITTAIMNGQLEARHGQVGIWTDDCSMALCMADSILINDYKFDPKHIRYMFILWLEHGLNNGGRPWSIGLGGNISISMSEFMAKQTEYAETGDQFNNGNGSLMRLSPIPVAFSKDIDSAMLYSGLQSRTTHNGLEAEHCARLMSCIIVNLINRGPQENPKQLILKVCDQFKSDVKSVVCLARGVQEPAQIYEESCEKYSQFKKFNKTIADRNWNWRDRSHTYSPCRNKQQPGYIGSYCMDALAMALHTVLFTNSLKEVVAWNADMGGDCDTVGAIAGQIAGAIYGLEPETLRLYSEMVDFKQERYEVFLKAYKLANQKKLGE